MESDTAASHWTQVGTSLLTALLSPKTLEKRSHSTKAFLAQKVFSSYGFHWTDHSRSSLQTPCYKESSLPSTCTSSKPPTVSTTASSLRKCRASSPKLKEKKQLKTPDGSHATSHARMEKHAVRNFLANPLCCHTKSIAKHTPAKSHILLTNASGPINAPAVRRLSPPLSVLATTSSTATDTGDATQMLLL